jgi:dTMP kinase
MQETEIVPLFSLEGVDGSGKSTQQKLVSQYMDVRGFVIATPSSPSHNQLGEFIRANVRELEPNLRNRLFLLDMEYIVETESSKSAYDAMLWDRHLDSFLTSNPEMTIDEALVMARNVVPPTRTFLLDVSVDTILHGRKDVHDQHTVPEWLELKAARYREAADRWPERIEVIDGTLPRDQITAHIGQTMLGYI